MRISPIVNAFSAGELSPRLMGRTDSPKYASGAEVMENFIPLPHGGALRRGGLKHIAEVKTSAQHQRLIPFEYSVDQTYDLEIGDQYIRFYTESSGVYGQVQSGGSAYEISSPWLESEVDDIQYAQNADVMWLVHPNHPPQRLVRSGHTSWALTAESYGFTPLNEVNQDDTKTLAFQNTGTANQNLTANWNLFESSMVGQDMLVDVDHGQPTGEVVHVKIVSVTSATVAVVSIEDQAPPSTNATAYWQAPAFTATNGYPAAVVFYEQRLWYGGTKAKPQSMWGSKTVVYEDFETGANADDALFYTIASDRVNEIKWLAATRVMIAGTTGGEFRISGGSESAITPTNVDVRRQTSHGSRKGRPVYVGNEVFFIQRSNTKVRNVVYKWETDAFSSDDMTFLAEHISGNGIDHIVYSQVPDSIMLAIREDGQLLTMSYEPNQDIVAWSRHITDGEFIDVCATNRQGRDRWTFIVERVINGATKRYIETYEQDVFLDCFSHYSGSAATVITGLGFLEGKEVSILADGAVHPSKTVSGGQITLNYAAEEVYVGLQYISKLTPTRYGSNVGNGTAMGKKKRWNEIFVQLSNSAVPKINGERPPVRSVDTTYGTPQPLTSEDVNVRNLGYDDYGRVYIEHELPLPCHVVAIFGTLKVGD